MTFTPSNPADVALHKKYHTQNVLKGIELSRRFIEAVQAEDRVWSGPSGDYIISLNRSASSLKKKVVETVMNVVEEELGGTGIKPERVWSETVLRLERKEGEVKRSVRADRYKAFLYMRSSKCIAFLLAERISTAFKVLPRNPSSQHPSISNSTTQSLMDTADSSAITTSSTPAPAILGISRIWTSSSTRRSGIAKTLLDCTTGNFLYGFKVQKRDVAFSQPTDSGGRLARGWFGREDGWLVYSD
jgi:N-acetyltransferase